MASDEAVGAREQDLRGGSHRMKTLCRGAPVQRTPSSLPTLPSTSTAKSICRIRVGGHQAQAQQFVSHGYRRRSDWIHEKMPSSNNRLHMANVLTKSRT